MHHLRDAQDLRVEEAQRIGQGQHQRRHRFVESGRQFQEGFEQGYNAWWQFFGNLIFPNPIISALGIIFNPISLIVGWLIYGLLAFLFASLTTAPVFFPSNSLRYPIQLPQLLQWEQVL